MGKYVDPQDWFNPGARVWAYVRDSGGDGQEQSVSQQIDEIKRYCQEYGLVLEKIFTDVAKSGTTVAGRQKFQEMMNQFETEANLPAGLLLWNFARFARECDDATLYKAMIRHKKVKILSMTDPIPAGNFGRVVEVIIDGMNQEKSLQTSRDAKRGLEALVRNGFSPGGTPPRGYIAVQVQVGEKRTGHPRFASRWQEDPEIWDMVKLAWILRAQGRSYSEIQEATRGVIYKSKNCWATFFSNISYLGIGKCGENQFPNHHPAAVDQATWDAVQAIQRTNSLAIQGFQEMHPRRIHYPSLLSGYAKCTHCGSAMMFSHSNLKSKNPWPFYICGKKNRQGTRTCENKAIGAKQVDEAVLNIVLDHILTPDFIQALLAETQKSFTNKKAYEEMAVQLVKKMKKIKDAIQKLLDTIEKFGSENVIDRLQKREQELKELETEMQELEIRKAAAELNVTPEAMELVLGVWRGKIVDARNCGNVRELRALLFPRIITQVELGYDRVRIIYSFPLSELAKQDPRLARWVGNGSIVTMIEKKRKKPENARPVKKEKPTAKQKRNQQIYEEFLAGMTCKALAEEFKVSEQIVWRAIRLMRASQNESGEDEAW
ncbi:MAG TPA: recombinase family protein [Anaerolineaceae bacterium]|nr:recombinase family protein [Anaerolineaceae bacterium]HPN54115.1 recombinase family protein [Anaerolineaceae bacterium]